MVVSLPRAEVGEATGCAEPEARRVLRLMADGRTTLMEIWRHRHD